MKRIYLLILAALTSLAAFSQQLPSQVQAKRGVFTERLYLTDRWIDRITPDMSSSDSANDHILPTAKAVADYMRSHTLANFANTDLTLTGDRYHNGGGYNLTLDNLKRFELNAGYDEYVNHIELDTQLLYLHYGPGTTVKLNAQSANWNGMVSGANTFNDTFEYSSFKYIPSSAGWNVIRQNNNKQAYQKSGITSVLDSTYSIVESRNKDDLSLFNRSGYYQTLTGFTFTADGSLNPSLDFNLINLPLSSDATNHKPLGIDNNGKLYQMNSLGNFATENLTLTGNRFHSLFNHTLNFEGAGPFYKSRSTFGPEEVIFSLYDSDENNYYNKVEILRNGTKIENRDPLANTWSSVITSSFGVQLESRSITSYERGQIRVDTASIDFYQSNGNFKWLHLKPVLETANFQPLVVDGNGHMYKLNGWPQGTGTTLPQHFSQTSTVTVSGTTSETSIIGSGTGSLTIPASAWIPGKSYRVTIYGTFSTNNSTPAYITLRLKIGDTTVATATSVVYTGAASQFSANVNITCRSTGTSGNIFAFGTFTRNSGVFNWNKGVDASGTSGASVIDLTTDQTIGVTAQLSDASNGNTISSYIVNLEEIQ